MAKKWRCTVCGYIHEGPEAPDQCPMCKVGKEKFVEVVEQEGNLEFVTEHVIGDGKGASKELWEGLQNHFMGECTEVGMYLAMSRQADREGYPEIAEAYKRYAWEEAEHASKFAELIGEVVWDTKTNLYKRMNAESGACEDKMRLARMAKEQNLDAVLEVMKFIYDHIMYAELNTKSDYCQVCGYDGEIEIKEDEDGKLIWVCPQCGNTDQSKMNVARRTCGYIGTQYWNQGRTQEIRDRVLHL